jgi:phospholipid/cholesterol/gamma-HCH transport system substrate-binding protein
MRALEPADRRRIGLMAITVALLAILVGQSFTSVPVLFAQPSYYAQLTDTGGLNKNNPVRIAGMDVGNIQGITIDGDHIKIKFTTGHNTIGTETRLAIRTDTILGKKVLEVEPRGTQTLRPGATLPVGQSTTPYQIYDAFFDVTKAASGWDIDTVKRSLHVLAQTVDQTYPHLSAALDGVAKFSDIIGNRDDQVKHLLAQAHQVADILGDRGEQIDTLLVHANTLLAAVNERGRAISLLLQRISSFSTQVQGLINDNPNLNHVLEQFRIISDILAKHKNDLASVLITIGKFAPALSETNASGPFLNGMITNLLPYWILQPWVDAAFKKRGIDPEEFWRGAGLPAFRFPDPNGTRFPNGAPPPAPPVLEGTPDHPGPAVAPGSPCSYAPPPQLLPRPGNPLPCAGVDQNRGPFGPLPGGFPAPVDVQTSPPNPNGLPPTPGIPIAGRPGKPAPDVPGTPVPQPPNAPPGARTEPLGPAGPTPPPSTFAPGLPPGPPAPAGPGPQLPAPGAVPGGTGGSGQ